MASTVSPLSSHIEKLSTKKLIHKFCIGMKVVEFEMCIYLFITSLLYLVCVEVPGIYNPVNITNNSTAFWVPVDKVCLPLLLSSLCCCVSIQLHSHLIQKPTYHPPIISSTHNTRIPVSTMPFLSVLLACHFVVTIIISDSIS